MIHGVEGEAGPLDGIGAHVGLEGVVDGDQRPVAPETDARGVELLPIVPRRDEVLAPPLDPLHGLSEASRDGRDQQLLVVDGPLRAEAAAHVGRHRPDLLGGEPEGHGDGVADEIGVLGRRPDDQGAGLRIGIREDAARLDRHRGDARMVEPLLHHEVGRRQGGLRLADRAARDDGGVVGPVAVNPLAGPGRGLERGHRRERLVVDRDPVHGVGEPVRIVRHDDGDGLADVADLLAGERDLDVGTGAGRPSERGRDTRGRPRADRTRRRPGRREGPERRPRRRPGCARARAGSGSRRGGACPGGGDRPGSGPAPR